MIKYFSMCRMARETARHSISRQIQYLIKNFLTISKAEATLLFTEQMEGIYSYKEDKSLYINNVEKIDPINTIKYAEKTDGK